MTDDLPSLSAIDLSRSFDDGQERNVVLDNVSMNLNRGELAVLMGPSGSGKSTLLAILSGLLEPDADSGEVIARDDLGEHSIWRMDTKKREQFRLRNVGFIFQGYNLFPALNARQQLEIVLEWGYGTSPSDARKRSDEMLTKLGLAKKMRHMPSQLSGGEKQRVAIGRALIKKPRFCFADEPTSALDWKHGEQVIELLRSAAREEGATILVVSHDHRILPYVDTSFNLLDGRMVEGEPEDTHDGSKELMRLRSEAV